MKTIKVKTWAEVPQNYTGVVEWEDGDKRWYKNGKWHREDGPAYIKKIGYKIWYLDGKYVWDSHAELDLISQIVLSKIQHSEYLSVQVWKILDKDRVYEQIIVPGMEEFIIE